ncbi:cupin domain-containing protein [Nitratireductor sp. StC3]|uniref:cupin domain-containing protein n=1 Tax=Nitratireductor sp. StC3 TaxID=2126741 RepID=UPI000D0DBA48|nr:cupin domain-containing protein [Nitratireductor sp. StC3]PSM17761.1 cupin domain-containing protein [Nitratireductor sp. StC3]
MSRHDFDPATVAPDGRPPAKARLFDGTRQGPHRGSVAGEVLATQVTVLTYGNDEPGTGPVLHVHPYDEVFVVQQGRARFFVGEAVIDAEAGETVLGPAGVPHRFVNLGPGRLQTLDIHLSPRWIQTDLE